MTVHRRLLKEKELTFQRAYELAVAHETSEKYTAELNQKEAMITLVNPEGQSVHQLQKQPAYQVQKQPVPKAADNRPTDKISSCFHRSGKLEQKQFECWFKDVKCFGCGKLGIQRLFVAQ